MIKTDGKFRTKIKRYLLDFSDDEERLQEEKAKTKYALQRLQAKNRKR